MVAIALYVLANVIAGISLNFLMENAFIGSILQTIVSGLSFILLFLFVTRHYVPICPSNFWLKFFLLTLLFFLFYAVLALMFGQPLLHAMGFELVNVPPGVPFTSDQFEVLSFFTYGISSITNGLSSLAVAHLLQKYMVRGIFYVFKRTTKYRNFFEAGSGMGRSSILVTALWLLFLPFPIQNVLSPSPVGVNVLGTSLYLLSVLALFAMWGLGLANVVGITEKQAFRLYNSVRDTLFWFLVIQWLSVVVYSSVTPALVTSVFTTYGLLIARVLFAFAPPAVITAYVYKRVLEKQSAKRIFEYLKEKETLASATILVKAENSA